MRQILIIICFTVFLFAQLTKATFFKTDVTNVTIPASNSSNASQVQLTTLYIGAFFDLSKKDGYGSLPMAQQAIEEINNNTGLLPGYKLELVVKSTQVGHKNVCYIVNPQGRQNVSNSGFSDTLIADCLARNFIIKFSPRKWLLYVTGRLEPSSSRVRANHKSLILQAPVVQTLDNALQRINRYPVDKC